MLFGSHSFNEMQQNLNDGEEMEGGMKEGNKERR